jgi:hypothetical protein
MKRDIILLDEQPEKVFMRTSIGPSNKECTVITLDYGYGLRSEVFFGLGHREAALKYASGFRATVEVSP